MRRVDIKRYRDQASRLLALASTARKNGDYDFAASLVRRATQYLDMVAAAERLKTTTRSEGNMEWQVWAPVVGIVILTAVLPGSSCRP